MVCPTSLATWPPELLAAVHRNAQFQAELTAACLNALEERVRDAGFAEGCQNLPRAFLLEFAAIAQLKLWELQGLRELLPPDVPNTEEASCDLQQRISGNPADYGQNSDAPLARRVMQIWIENFVWLEPGLIDADVVIGQASDDDLIEALAQLLWENRRISAKSN